MAKNKKRICGECPECLLGPKNSCFWQIEKAVPEHFKPSLIKSYVSLEEINGIHYLKALELGEDFNTEFLSWFLSFCVGHQINVFWKTKNVPFYLGSPIFLENMTKVVIEGEISK
jgi:hypothetical protein